MTKPLVRIHNVETDEIVDREMTDAEFAIYQAEQKTWEEEALAAAKKAADRLALLEKLGITENEAKLLLG